MNSLHPTATDGCETGLHAMVGGRCRDCGALQERTVPAASLVTAKQFLVTIIQGESTRWLCDDAKLARSVEIVASSATRIFSSGAEPLVHVQSLPGAAVTAASGPLVGGPSCDGAPPATDPAKPGPLSNAQRMEIEAKLRQASDYLHDAADLINREARTYVKTEWRESFADGSAAFFYVRLILGFKDGGVR